MESGEGRFLSSDENKYFNLGKVPFPKWAWEHPHSSGDRAVAIYDKATGIWRSFFYFVPNGKTHIDEDGKEYPVWTVASGGYILGEKDFKPDRKSVV